MFRVKLLFEKQNRSDEFFHVGFPLIFMMYYWEREYLEIRVDMDYRYGNYISRFLSYISKSNHRLEWEWDYNPSEMVFRVEKSVKPRDFLREYRDLRDALLFLENAKPRDKKVRVAVACVTIAYAVKLAHFILPGNTVYLSYPSGYLSVESEGDFYVSINDSVTVAKVFSNLVKSVSNVDVESEELISFVGEVFSRDSLLRGVERYIQVLDGNLRPRLNINFVYDVFSLNVSPRFMVYLQRIDYSSETNTYIKELSSLKDAPPYSLALRYVLDRGPPLYFIVLGFRNPNIIKYVKNRESPTAIYDDIVTEMTLRKNRSSKSFLKNWIEVIYLPFMSGLSVFTLPIRERK